jgi:hypothetical protein
MARQFREQLEQEAETLKRNVDLRAQEPPPAPTPTPTPPVTDQPASPPAEPHERGH